MTERRLPPPSPFAADDGGADPALAAVLAEHAAGRAGLPEVVAALAGVRVLVPVLAHPKPEPARPVRLSGGPGDGAAAAAEEVHAADDAPAAAGDPAEGSGSGGGTAAMAATGVVALRTPDGRTALPVFSSTATMALWRPDARPVPAMTDRAALSAVQEGWSALVLDPAGPVPVLVPRPATWAIAQGRAWRPAVLGTQVDPAVRDAVVTAVSALPEVRGVDVAPGRGAELAVVLSLQPGLTRARLDGVIARVNAALAASGPVAELVDSVELRISAAPAVG